MRRFMAAMFPGMLGLAGGVSIATAQVPGARVVTAFVDVNVIPMDRDRVLAHQTVVVRDGHIAQLGPIAQVPIPAGARRIDGRGKFLIPGLADMHTHLAYAGGFDPDIRLSDAAGRDSLLLASAERQLFVMLANGITTIRNVDFLGGREKLFDQHYLVDGPALLRLKARAASGKLLSPRIHTSSKWRLDTTKNVDENVRLYKAAGYDHLKMYLDANDSVFADSMVRAVHRYGVPLIGHGFGDPSGGPGLQRTIAARFSTTEHFTGFWQYLGGDTAGLQERVDSMARAGIWQSPTTGLFAFNPPIAHPTPLEVRYGPAEFARARGEFSTSWASMMTDTTGAIYTKLDTVDFIKGWRAVVQGFHKAGPGLLLGSDPGPQMGPVGFMAHLGLQLFVMAGLTPYEALATGTVNVARYYGTTDSTGTVAVGKRADLVLLDGNPLENIRCTGDIAGVMIGGRWVSRATIERRLAGYYQGRVAPFDALAFVNVNVVPLDRERVLPRQTVIVRDGKIIAMGPVARIKVPVNATRIDGRGKFLMPGLTDLHTHLAPDIKPERQLFELLANGITTIRSLDIGQRLAMLSGVWSPRIYASSPWRADSAQGVAFNVGAAKSSDLQFLAIDTVAEHSAIIDSVKRAAQDSGLSLVLHGPAERAVDHMALPAGMAETVSSRTDVSPANVQDALRQVVRAGVRPYDALRAATLDAAREMGTADSAGTVAIGKRADLVLLDANPLTDIRNTEAIAGVVAGGRWMSPGDMKWRLRHYRSKD